MADFGYNPNQTAVTDSLFVISLTVRITTNVISLSHAGGCVEWNALQTGVILFHQYSTLLT
jgi:hypothetical protein